MSASNRRMVRAEASESGIRVRFEDGCEGLIDFREIPEIQQRAGLARLELPDPYEIHLLSVDGALVELPWDFARYFCDPQYRQRSQRSSG